MDKLEYICKKYDVEFEECNTGSIYVIKRNKENYKDFLEVRISDHDSISNSDYKITRFKPKDLRADKIVVKIALLLLGFKVKGKIANIIYQQYLNDKSNMNVIHIHNYKYISYDKLIN